MPLELQGCPRVRWERLVTLSLSLTPFLFSLLSTVALKAHTRVLWHFFPREIELCLLIVCDKLRSQASEYITASARSCHFLDCFIERLWRQPWYPLSLLLPAIHFRCLSCGCFKRGLCAWHPVVISNVDPVTTGSLAKWLWARLTYLSCTQMSSETMWSNECFLLWVEEFEQ